MKKTIDRLFRKLGYIPHTTQRFSVVIGKPDEMIAEFKLFRVGDRITVTVARDNKGKFISSKTYAHEAERESNRKVLK